jgi:hypothetical protein
MLKRNKWMRKLSAATAIATIMLNALPAAADWNNNFPVGANDPNNKLEFVMLYKGKNYYSESGYMVHQGQFRVFDIIDFTVSDLNTPDVAVVMNVRFYMADCVNMLHWQIARSSGIDQLEVRANIHPVSGAATPIGTTLPPGVRSAEICVGDYLAPVP